MEPRLSRVGQASLLTAIIMVAAALLLGAAGLTWAITYQASVRGSASIEEWKASYMKSIAPVVFYAYYAGNSVKIYMVNVGTSKAFLGPVEMTFNDGSKRVVWPSSYVVKYVTPSGATTAARIGPVRIDESAYRISSTVPATERLPVLEPLTSGYYVIKVSSVFGKPLTAKVYIFGVLSGKAHLIYGVEVGGIDS